MRSAARRFTARRFTAIQGTVAAWILCGALQPAEAGLAPPPHPRPHLVRRAASLPIVGARRPTRPGGFARTRATVRPGRHSWFSVLVDRLDLSGVRVRRAETRLGRARYHRGRSPSSSRRTDSLARWLAQQGDLTDKTCHDVSAKLFESATGCRRNTIWVNRIFSARRFGERLQAFADGSDRANAFLVVDLCDQTGILHTFAIERRRGAFRIHNHFATKYTLREWYEGHHDRAAMKPFVKGNATLEESRRLGVLPQDCTDQMWCNEADSFSIRSCIRTYGGGRELDRPGIRRYMGLLQQLVVAMDAGPDVTRRNALSEQCFGVKMWREKARGDKVGCYRMSRDDARSAFVILDEAHSRPGW